MNTTTIFLYFVIACISAAAGGLIERTLHRRTKPHPPAAASEEEPGRTLAGEDDVEIMGAWRMPDNKIWLEMDGARLDNKEALQPGQRQRLLSLLIDLRPWLETVRPAASGSEAPPSVAPPPPIQPAPTSQPDKKAGKRTGEAAPVPVFKSIVEQIDEVLQAKLPGSPLKDRKIRLAEELGGAVIVWDGLNSYEGIDAIPDPEVKALIRQAVAEWEKGTK